MKTLLVGAVLCCCSCATVRVERFEMPGDAASLRQSTEEAAARIGWTTEAAEGGDLRILEYPRQHWLWKKPLKAWFKDGEVFIEGERQGASTDPIEGARILAHATRQVRGEIVLGSPVEERSEAITVALDVLLPAAGAFYALRGHPAYDTGAATGMRTFWWEFAMRATSDAVALGLAAELVVLRNRDGSSIFPAWYFAMPIVMMVSMRIGALLNDLVELPFRNAYARSGLRAPPD